jgi:hypothetical protein
MLDTEIEMIAIVVSMLAREMRLKYVNDPKMRPIWDEAVKTMDAIQSSIVARIKERAA